MIPWLKLLPQRDIILAPFRTNETIGLLLLLGCFALYLRIGRPLAGGLAALLLATQPAFVTYSRSSMSDLSGAAAAVLAFALVYLGLHHDAVGRFTARRLCSACPFPYDHNCCSLRHC
jgi:4-amino-4-deoxy-L-arabinose transferase-like glycosyltransferase